MTKEERDIILKAVHEIVDDQWRTVIEGLVRIDKRLRKLEDDSITLYGFVHKGRVRAKESLYDLVRRQIRDEGLWFGACTAPEAYLQQSLRELHRAVEEGERDESTN